MTLRHMLCTAMLLNAAFRPVHTVAAAPPPARATIDISCAPWDGPAFVLTIPSDETTSTSVVTVAIWQEARIARPTVFRLPDNTGRVGVAFLTHAGKREDLAGSISFDSVAAGKPVIGSINFTSAGGLRIERQFRAAWGTRREFCGT
jgi:hypothetical protein